MIKKIAAIAIAGLFATATAAHADTVGTTASFTLTQGGSVATTPGDYGSILLTQSATGVVTVTETLKSNEYYAGTGAGYALTFNLTGDPSVTIGNLTSGFAAGPAPATVSPFGSFMYSVECWDHDVTGGACHGGNTTNSPGPLSFTVTSAAGVNVSQFVGTTTGYFFSSDIFIGNVLTGVGNTGVVASLGGTPMDPTPEPSSLIMLGTGIVGAAGMLRRRFAA